MLDFAGCGKWLVFIIGTSFMHEIAVILPESPRNQWVNRLHNVFVGRLTVVSCHVKLAE